MQTQNMCTFPKIEAGMESKSGEKCGLYFRNMNELIHHTEEEHIPLIEAKKTAELKMIKEQFAASGDPSNQEQYDKAYAAWLNQPIPISLICKLRPFPKGHKVQPIPPPKQRTMKFCYYKPKPVQQQPSTEPTTAIPPSIPMNDSLTSSKTLSSAGSTAIRPSNHSSLIDSISAPIGSAMPSKKFSKTHQIRHNVMPNEELCASYALNDDHTLTMAAAEEPAPKRLYCEVDGCRKAYKNQQGLRSCPHKGRNHLRNMHGIGISSSMDSVSSVATAGSSPTNLNLALANSGSGTSASRLSASEEGILSRQLPGRQSPFVLPTPQQQQRTHQSGATFGASPSDSTTIGTLLAASSSSSPLRGASDTKYQCQHCVRGYKTMVNLNKHLNEAHNITILGSSSPSSRYPSPVSISAAGNSATQPQPQLFGTHQQSSPQRAMSSSSSITIVPATKGVSLQQQLATSDGGQTTPSFIAPTLTARHHQPSLVQYPIGRPSAPVPPCTPPSASPTAAHHQLAYSPQSASGQTVTSLLRSPPTERLMTAEQTTNQQQPPNASDHHMSSQHYYIPQQQLNAIDQHPPVLQPQTTNTHQRYRYTYHQPNQQQQQRHHHHHNQQMEQQQAYASSGVGPSSYFVGQGQQSGGGTTTIFVTQQSQQQLCHGRQQSMEQMDLQQQQQPAQQFYSRPYYRHQTAHYMVEPVQQTQPHAASSSPYPIPSTQRQIRGVTQHIQQQQQQQQQPFMAVRTAPIQAPHKQHHRIFAQQPQQQQQQQFYQQRQQQRSSERTSPATVAAVLASTNDGSGEQQQTQ